MKKRLFILVCVMALVLSMFGCSDSNKKENYELSAAEKVAVEDMIKSFFSETVSLTTDQLITERIDFYEKQMSQSNDASAKKTLSILVNTLKSWQTSYEELGVFKEILDVKVASNEEAITVTIKAQFADRKADYVCIMAEDEPSASFNPEYTFNEKMKKAGVNTLLGMGTVFTVLIIIIIIISMLKYVNVFAKGAPKKEKVTVSDSAIDNTIAQIVQKEEDLSDDLELVAVITAAITAYESSKGGSTEGLVVRTIKKSNRSKWQNAM